MLSLAAYLSSTDYTFRQLVLICGKESLRWLFKVTFYFQIMFIYRTEHRLFHKPLQDCVLDIVYNYEGCSTADTGYAIANAVTFIKIDCWSFLVEKSELTCTLTRFHGALVLITDIPDSASLLECMALI